MMLPSGLRPLRLGRSWAERAPRGSGALMLLAALLACVLAAGSASALMNPVSYLDHHAGLTPREIYADARKATHLLRTRLHRCVEHASNASAALPPGEAAAAEGGGPDMNVLVECIHGFTNRSAEIALAHTLGSALTSAAAAPAAPAVPAPTPLLPGDAEPPSADDLDIPTRTRTAAEPAARRRRRRSSLRRRRLLSAGDSASSTTADASSDPTDGDHDEPLSDDEALAVAAAVLDVSLSEKPPGHAAEDDHDDVDVDAGEVIDPTAVGAPKSIVGADGRTYTVVRDLASAAPAGVVMISLGDQAPFDRPAPQTVDPEVLADFHESFSRLQDVPSEPGASSTFTLISAQFIARIPNATVEGPAGLIYDAAGHVYYQHLHFFERRGRGGRPLESQPRPGAVVAARSERYPKLATLIQGFGDMYYHYVAETLPRLALLKPILDADPELRLLMWARPYEAAYLTRMGIDLGRVVVYDPDVAYSADELVYPTPTPRITPSREGLLAARAALGIVEAPAEQRTALVWVSRADEPSRHISNENELLDAIRARFPHQEIVYFTRDPPQGAVGGNARVVTYGAAEGSLTLDGTIELFGRAAVIAGPHGAGLAHALFASAACTIVELQFMRDPPMMFWHVAAALKQSYWLVPVPQAYWMQAEMIAPKDEVIAVLERATGLAVHAPCAPGHAPASKTHRGRLLRAAEAAGAATDAIGVKTSDGYARRGSGPKGACGICPAGSYSFNGFVCAPCFAGQHAPEAGAGHCATCPANFYATADGRTCVACLPGRTAWLPGSFEAEQCLEKEAHAAAMQRVLSAVALARAGGKSRMLAEGGSATAVYQPYIGLVPPQSPSGGIVSGTLWQLLMADPDLSDFAAALAAAGFDGPLKNATGSLTLLAPLNGAFDLFAHSLNLTKAQLMASPSLPALLAYHLLPGGAHLSDSLVDGQALPTAEGQSVTVSITDVALYFDAAMVDTADLTATNGVMDVLQAVLIPANFVFNNVPIGAPAGADACPVLALGGLLALQIACASPEQGCTACVPTFAGALCSAGLNGANFTVLNACLRQFTPQLITAGVPLGALQPAACSVQTAVAAKATCNAVVSATQGPPGDAPTPGPAPGPGTTPALPPSPALVPAPVVAATAACPANITWSGLGPACAASVASGTVCTTCLTAIAASLCAARLDVSNATLVQACTLAAVPTLQAAGVPLAQLAVCDVTASAALVRSSGVCPVFAPAPAAACPQAIDFAPAKPTCAATAANATVFCGEAGCMGAIGKALCGAGVEVASPSAMSCLSSTTLQQSLAHAGISMDAFGVCAALPPAAPALAAITRPTCASLGAPLVPPHPPVSSGVASAAAAPALTYLLALAGAWLLLFAGPRMPAGRLA